MVHIFKIYHFQVDSSRRYDRIEVLHAYVTMEIKQVRFWGSSFENWVSWILKILTQLDLSRRYDRIEVLHDYATIEIKEVRFWDSFISSKYLIFPTFNTSIHAYFLSVLLRYIHLFHRSHS